MNALPPSFWGHVDKSGDCWEWTGGRAGGGYGRFHIAGVQRQAHRLAYEDAKGAVPADLDMDHLCRNRGCVNPDHLEPVTRQINLLRSPITITAINAAKTECVNGHVFTDDNTMYLKNGTRRCRVCRRASTRRAKAKLAVA